MFVLDLIKNYFFEIGVILFVITICLLMIFEAFTNSSYKVYTYENILNKEFGQVFNTYDEYILYKIEKGG